MGARKKINDLEAMQMLEEGKSVGEIATEFGVTYASAYEWKKKMKKLMAEQAEKEEGKMAECAEPEALAAELPEQDEAEERRPAEGRPADKLPRSAEAMEKILRYCEASMAALKEQFAHGGPDELEKLVLFGKRRALDDLITEIRLQILLEVKRCGE